MLDARAPAPGVRPGIRHDSGDMCDRALDGAATCCPPVHSGLRCADMPLASWFARRRWPWSLAVALVTFAVPLAHPGMSLPWDWDEFNSFSHFAHSSVWSYHTWPLHDPWACGGNDLWANPQSRLFSPFVVLDLLLPAHLANL